MGFVCRLSTGRMVQEGVGGEKGVSDEGEAMGDGWGAMAHRER